MFDAEDPAAQSEAYATIGKLLVTWALIDQAVVRNLWHRNRLGMNLPTLDNTFPKRWKAWRDYARARWPEGAPLTWEDFEFEQASAQAIRNALAHWTVGVRGRSGRFSVLVQPYELAALGPALKRWWSRVQHLPLLRRHPMPSSGRPSLWWDWQLGTLVSRWDALLAVTRYLASDDGGDISADLAVLAEPQQVFFT